MRDGAAVGSLLTTDAEEQSFMESLHEAWNRYAMHYAEVLRTLDNRYMTGDDGDVP